ncbi:dynein light chain Tctex-type 1, partial [Selaginella moellendorffii]|uniref:dynein light chain Tctex-type 1 n=1 Tax=Selaginella moellendorffii TaxID=88036 RepID=UPI000D1C4683
NRRKFATFFCLILCPQRQTFFQPRFLPDEINGIIKDALDQSLGSNQFRHDKVTDWTTSVCEVCLNNLVKLDKPFKYAVTCLIMQKNGAGMVTATSCFWDTAADGRHIPRIFPELNTPVRTGSKTIRWENKTMYCIVTVFGLQI